MIIANAVSYIVGAALAVAQPKEGRPARPPSSGAGGGKLCPYNLPAEALVQTEKAIHVNYGRPL